MVRRMRFPRARFLIPALLVSFSASTCANLSLPAPPTSPHLTDFFPKSAFIGDQVHLVGTG